MWILTPFSWKSHQVVKLIEKPWKMSHWGNFFHTISPLRMDFFSIALTTSWTLARTTVAIYLQAIKRYFSLLKAFIGSLTSVLTIKNGEPSLPSRRIMNYLQFYRIFPWAKHSFNLDHFLLRNIQTVFGPPQSWWFTWQISNPWEIISSYFNNTMSELARNECLQGHALIKPTRRHLSICDRTIHLLNIWATVPHQNFRELH